MRKSIRNKRIRVRRRGSKLRLLNAAIIKLLRICELCIKKAAAAVKEFFAHLSIKRAGIALGGLTVVVVLSVVLFSPRNEAPDPAEAEDALRALASLTTVEAIPSPTPTPAPTPEPTLHPINSPFFEGTDSPVVSEIQERLMQLGFMEEDEPTEHYGPITKGAVRLFQRQHGLDADGAVGQETYTTLMSDEAQDYLISEGIEGTDVKELQIRLRELGYLNTATSYYGTDTTAAIKKFQDRNGLSPDGMVGKVTYEKLYSEDVRANAFAYGEESPEIKNFQERLKKLAYYTGEIDGKYGKSTVTAVKRFQERNGLIADGYVGPETKSLLRSSRAQANALMLGMRGNDIEKMQARLKELNYLKSATGYFGTDTQNAVVAFQKNNGLSADGKVGAYTMERLLSKKAKAWTSSKAPPKDSGSSSSGSKGSSSAGPAKNLSGVEAFIAVANSHLGVKYVRGGKSPDRGFDCSGFVYWCLNQAGIKQGYMTSSSWQKTEKYPKIGSLSNAQKGDVLSFKGHVGIALGGGKMIDASSSQGKIRIANLNTPYWSRNYVAGFRIF